jgi:hypothetical protein
LHLKEIFLHVRKERCTIWSTIDLQVKTEKTKMFHVFNCKLGLDGPQYSILTAGTHGENPLNTHFGINNERQDCDIGTECVERYLWKGKGKWRR